jgi:DNA-binding NtrC family response regulator
MEDQEYQLVLSDLQMESPEAGLRVLAHAKMMDYKPATALITAYHSINDSYGARTRMLVQPEDVPGLLGKVANLIARRVGRKVQRELRHTELARQS